MTGSTKDARSLTQTVRHPFPPLCDADSRILILGSFPSVKSREQCFFYGHPQNRFWKVTAAVFGDAVPADIPQKKAFLHAHHIALWDVIAQCDIAGSSDSSIRNVIPNDLSVILRSADIRQIFVNGGTAAKYYDRFQRSRTGLDAVQLPSTSPANAAWTPEKLIAAWSVIRRAADF